MALRGRDRAGETPRPGAVKSRRYQPTDPAMLALEKSPALKALGTVVAVQPSVAATLANHPLLSPWSVGISAIEPCAAEQVATGLAVAVQRFRRSGGEGA